MLGGIHTSIVTSTNVLLDLLSSPADSDFFGLLREEVDGLFSTPESWNDATLVAKLVLADSTIRESLRRSPVITKNILREVIKLDGMLLPDGQHVPKGAWLAVPSAAMHFDDRLYPEAQKYNPFRFVRVEKKTEDDAQLKLGKNQSLSNTSETFLGFGHGRHSW